MTEKRHFLLLTCIIDASRRSEYNSLLFLILGNCSDYQDKGKDDTSTPHVDQGTICLICT